MRQRRIRLAVWTVSAVVLVACVLWALLVQVLVPDVCELPSPPANAQYVHCD
jgi:hypothetical protein